MPVDKEFVRLYRATVEGVCRARAFPGELHDLKSCAWTRIVERQKSIFRAKPENRRAYVRMVAASAVIDWLKKKSPPAFYALTPEDLERALPHFAGIGLSPEVLEKSGLLNQQFFERKDFVNAARAIIGYGDKTALLCGMLARLALKRADVRAYVENADEPDEGDDEGFLDTGGDREDPWEPETGDGSMPVRPLGPSEGISPEDGDAALCLVSALKEACDGGRLNLRQILAFFFYWYEKSDSSRGAAIRCAEVFGLAGPDDVAELDRRVKRILRERLGGRDAGEPRQDAPAPAKKKGGRRGG